MTYCKKCGNELETDAEFCTNCGTPAVNSDEKRKEVYDGKIHKCPSCGEVIKSFCVNCPTCGFEFRSVDSLESLKDLSYKLSKLNDEKQKESLIRNFPIPNTKEDIIEFLIMAKTNLENDVNEYNRLISGAWKVKLEQVYQKAKILFNNTDEINDITKMYLEAKKCITKKNIIKLILNNIIFIIGIAIMIVAIIVDKTGGNCSMIELISYIVIIAGATTLNKRNTSILEYSIAGAVGFAVIILSSLLDNGSMGEISGGIELIVVVVNFFKSFVKNK